MKNTDIIEIDNMDDNKNTPDTTKKEDSTDNDIVITMNSNDDITALGDFDVKKDFPNLQFTSGTPTMRPRNVMYTQSMDFILKTFGSVKKFVKHIQRVVCKHKDDEYALIIHNKDNSKIIGKGKAIDHIHVAFMFKNGHALAAIARALLDFRPDGSPNVQTLTIFNHQGGRNNMLSYLCHRTARAKNKYQYDPKDVIANFDYVGELANITQQVQNAIAANPKNQALIFEQLKNREITLLEAENMLPAKVYATQLNNLRNVSALANKLEAKEWRERRQASNDFTKVIWIWGDAGTGKTRLATEIASGLDENYFYSGAERGVWDDYEATQHVAVIDECRPAMFESFREMLSLLDNYQTRAVASARYYNRELALDYIIITSVYNPFYFYNNMGITDKHVDCFHQLERRISCCIYMDGDFIYDSSYSENDSNYITNPNRIIKNPFSEKKLSHNGISPVSIDFRQTVFQSSSVLDYYDAVDSSYCEDAFNDDDEFEVIADDIYSDYDDTYLGYDDTYSDDDDDFSDYDDTNSGYDTDNDCEENS